MVHTAIDERLSSFQPAAAISILVVPFHLCSATSLSSFEHFDNSWSNWEAMVSKCIYQGRKLDRRPKNSVLSKTIVPGIITAIKHWNKDYSVLSINNSGVPLCLYKHLLLNTDHYPIHIAMAGEDRVGIFDCSIFITLTLQFTEHICWTGTQNFTLADNFFQSSPDWCENKTDSPCSGR